jgi:hypothetical protein
VGGKESKCIDKLTLCPGNLIETEQNALVMQSLPNQVTAFGRDVVVVFAEDLEEVYYVSL